MSILTFEAKSDRKQWQFKLWQAKHWFLEVGLNMLIRRMPTIALWVVIRCVPTITLWVVIRCVPVTF